jgi:fumarate reductase subunit C
MPGPLPRAKSNAWWNRSWAYRLVLLRELSSVFVAAYIVLLLVLVTQVRDGKGAFNDYLDLLESPLFWIIHAVILGFVQLHTSTWFRLTPKALGSKVAGKPVPSQLLVFGMYALWAGASIVVLAAFLVDW